MQKHNDPRFAKTHFACEATDCERSYLWQTFGPEGRIRKTNWGQDELGLLIRIGTLLDMPVMLRCSWAKIDGHLVLFYHICSRMADYDMQKTFLEINLPERYEHSDATNFGNLILEIERRNERV